MWAWLSAGLAVCSPGVSESSALCRENTAEGRERPQGPAGPLWSRECVPFACLPRAFKRMGSQSGKSTLNPSLAGVSRMAVSSQSFPPTHPPPSQLPSFLTSFQILEEIPPLPCSHATAIFLFWEVAALC